ncbi:MAG: DUF4835 family protein [Tannerellaceae bacterium]|nr:DUF4835 family protein [Tannerellaceae bacterium]
MNIKRTLFFIPLFLLLFLIEGRSQEINARVTINYDKIQTTNTNLFTTLQNALTEFINNRRWTDATFSVSERIDCTMTIILDEMNDNNFTGEIQIQARRPVYNSSYTTTLLNFRDRQLNFEYTEYEPLEYSEQTLYNNLTATVMFYIYVILGLDFDSFSLKGGTAYYQQAQQIVNLAQSQSSWSGWRAFDTNNNRHAVITALTDNASEFFRPMWYTYHRRGLDEMAANPDRGRTTIIECLPALEQVRSTRPSSVVMQIFSDAKLDEIVAIYSKANSQEKQVGYKMLSNLYPAETSRLESMRN